MMESAFVHVACEGRIFTISPELLGRIKVKRDMETVRKILRAIEEKPDLKHVEMKFDGVDDLSAGRHLEMLISAGYVDALVHKTMNRSVPYVLVRDLTWEGHEFASALLADESVWQKVKGSLGDQLEKLPLKLVQDVITKALAAYVMQKVGL